MSPSSSPSEGGLFDGVIHRGGSAAQCSDAAWLRALLDVESALILACAEVGLVPDDAAKDVAAACVDAADYNIAELGRDATATGSVVVPLVRAIEERAGEAGAYVHFGATSQDILDTAMMLVARRSLVPLLEDLRSAAAAAWSLAATHRTTPMCGRSMLQPAIPTTFGLKAAVWALSLDGAADRLQRVSESLPVQLGGAVGTLASYQGHGHAVQSDMARRLDLVKPVLPWHTARLPIADLAGAAATAAGSTGKIALDIVLLAQAEVAEASEGVPGRGGSSTMPHKRNPVAAVLTRAAAGQVPGLASTLFGAMSQEQERAAGGWQAEWTTMTALLQCTGSAAAWLNDSVSHLHIDVDSMARNLVPVVSAAFAQQLADELAPTLGREAARSLLSEAAESARRAQVELRVQVSSIQQVTAVVTSARLDSLLASAANIDSAAALVDHALESRSIGFTS